MKSSLDEETELLLSFIGLLESFNTKIMMTGLIVSQLCMGRKRNKPSNKDLDDVYWVFHTSVIIAHAQNIFITIVHLCCMGCGPLLFTCI